MKHYTSIEQSKKLLELGLSPESADMYYQQCCSVLTEEYEWKPFIGEHLAVRENLFSYRNGYVMPCWSLGTLLDVFPSATLDSSDDHYYRLQCMGKSTEWYDSAIDACVDMIEKLHEQKSL